MITTKEIQHKIMEAIKYSGMTQTEIAKNLNIKQQTISKYLLGQALPSLDTLANLCVLLDLDANDILCIKK